MFSVDINQILKPDFGKVEFRSNYNISFEFILSRIFFPYSCSTVNTKMSFYSDYSNISMSNLQINSYQWYNVLAIKYFALFSIPCGILTNILILITLPRSTVRLNSRTRYLYLFYTINDCFLLFFKDIEDGFLDHSLRLITGGKVYVFLETLSIETCQVFLSGAFITEILVSYSITIMNFERFASICILNIT